MELYSKSYPVVADTIDTRYRLSASGVILFLQDTIASYMATWNAAAFDIAPDNLFWVVLEYDIHYDNQVPLWSDIVEVSISVSELTPMRVYFDFSMKGGDDIRFAHGTSVWSILNLETRLPFMQTHDFVIRKSGLDPLEMTVRHPKKKNSQKGEQHCSISYRAQRNDVDFNGHVSNRTYLPLALACFSEEFLRENSICSLNIKYLKETYFDDTIECTCLRSDDDYLCEMRSGAGDLVCQVATSWVPSSDVRDVRKLVLRR